jgi:hypothetical protein
MKTQQIVLASRPQGFPSLDNFRIEKITLPAPEQDEVLVQGLYYSVDPYMRGRMNDARSYISAFRLDEPIIGGVVAKVIKSKAAHLQPEDMVLGRLPWREQMVVPARGLQKIESRLYPFSYYLGALGMTGFTAYFGLMDICKPKAGQTVVVSGAAGAVGVMVGQIAAIQGCRVVGIAGSDEKINRLKTDYKFNEAINYKSTVHLKAALAQACPFGVDVYFDNVGGEISDAVLSLLNFQARVALCGQISLYNQPETPIGPRIQPIILSRCALMQGFLVGNYQNRFGESFQQLTRWVKEGKLKCPETIVKGFDQLPSAFIGLFTGNNMGKMIIEA